MLFAVLTVGAIGYGWLHRARLPVDAESGLGYWLGIIGASLMVLLLIYPLRKRLPRARWLGSTRTWFRVHMVFGVLGPLFVLYHSNFSLGSTNSSIALICMLAVAASGLVGRYIYTRIHYGLYGRRASLSELEVRLREPGRTPASLLPPLREALDVLNEQALRPPANVLAALACPFIWAVRTRISYWRLSALISREFELRARRSPAVATQRRKLIRMTRRHLRTHLANVRKVAEFNFFERLFALWHVFHLPLFLMMLLTAILHVLAVHMY